MKNEDTLEILRVLENYDFSTQDFIADGGSSVVSRAISHCTSCLGMDINDADTQNFIARRIEMMFFRKLSEKVAWLSDISSGAISCEIDGINVSGKARYQPKRITVTINCGKKKLSRSSCLLNVSDVIYTEEPFNGSPANEHGLECAKNMVMSLFSQNMAAMAKKDSNFAGNQI